MTALEEAERAGIDLSLIEVSLSYRLIERLCDGLERSSVQSIYSAPSKAK